MNESQVRLALDLIKQNGLIEVRVIGSRRYDIYSGYFKDVDNLVREISRFKDENIYFVLNKIDDACYNRDQREKIQKSKNTTSDSDIEGRTWLLIDIDAKRASGIGATDAEKSESKSVGNKVYKFLRDVGFSTPISADSGNGYHLLYPIMLENTPERTQLVKDVLLALDMMFSTKHATIDTSVFNASRITKLYGTTARKGSDSKDRPHRVSSIVNAPTEIIPTDRSLLEKVALMIPKPEKKARYNNYNNSPFDLDGFISKHGIEVRERSPFKDGEKIILKHCLFNESHGAKDAALFKLNNGAIGYKCFHNSCSSYGWRDVRLKFEPDAYSFKQRSSDYYNKFTTQPVVTKKVKTSKPTPKGDKFLEFSEIEEVDRSKLIYMKTHFEEFDKKMIGLLKGELSIVSGLSASGKSSILGQAALSVINDGFNVAFYSGELSPARVKNWVQLQAAGRQFTHSTDYETMFYVKGNHKKLIDEWIKGKFYLYNNDYGSEYSQMLKDVEGKIKKSDIDLIILDNVMTLNLDGLGYNSNDNQTKAVQSLSNLAKKYNVHVILVAHPRKAVSFLRAEDISGSGNIRNLADNILIMHRVNNDFRTRAGEFLGEVMVAEYEKFNNVLEVAKNRDMGIQDHFVGLYFEIESKRFLNEPYENIVYGWQDLLDTPLPPSPMPTSIEEVESGFMDDDTKSRETSKKEFEVDKSFNPDDKLPF